MAGPVVAAAVFLKTFRFTARIDDSKKLSPSQREEASPEIIAKSVFGIGIVSEVLIDEVNIRNATRLAMEQAVGLLVEKLAAPSKEDIHILVDGDMALTLGYPCTTIIRGDSKSKSIAAASILAKVTRDRLMFLYDLAYPSWGFKQHKGYPTAGHRAALQKFGACPIHRKSFCGVG